jgi:fructose-1,6-bisphosphatase II
MDRDLAIGLARVTEAAALSSATWLGRGDKNAADGAAVNSMRKMFDTLYINGTVVIGEGEMDEAPMLYIGEQIGKKDPKVPEVDIAVDPVDGTTPLAKGLPNAIAVVAIAPRGCMLNAPDMYMDKIAVGPKAKGVIDINAPIEDNLRAVADALNKNLSDVTVTMLDRERHSELVARIRKVGCRIKLFQDGDIATGIATCFEHTGVDMMVGRGGAPEGVILAAALKCMGGDMQGKLYPQNEEEKTRCEGMGIDCSKVLKMEDLVKGNEAYFAATGISDGDLLKGVVYYQENTAKTHSVVMRAETGTIRFIEAIHKLDRKPDYFVTK